MQRPHLQLSATVLGSPDPVRLARFYRELLGWTAVTEADDWVTLRPEGGGTGLSFQREARYRPPVWPPEPGEQQMTAHLDVRVEGDLGAAEAWACSLGAHPALHQPEPGARVLLDPDGHPFCLFVSAAPTV